MAVRVLLPRPGSRDEALGCRPGSLIDHSRAGKVERPRCSSRQNSGTPCTRPLLRRGPTGVRQVGRRVAAFCASSPTSVDPGAAAADAPGNARTVSGRYAARNRPHWGNKCHSVRASRGRIPADSSGTQRNNVGWRKQRKAPENRGFSHTQANGRGWDRTSDPSRVKRVLSR
jgi:hypothetical protein